MSVPQLKSEWQTIFATTAPNNSRAFLEGRLAYRIQELTYGGPDRETRRMLDLLADEVGGTLTRKSQIAEVPAVTLLKLTDVAALPWHEQTERVFD